MFPTVFHLRQFCTVQIIVLERIQMCNQLDTAPDFDGGGPGAQAWWEAPCADTESLGRGWSMKSVVFTWIA